MGEERGWEPGGVGRGVEEKAHLRRFETSRDFPMMDFLSLLFKYTFKQSSPESKWERGQGGRGLEGWERRGRWGW